MKLNLRSVDLNLLPVFEAVYEERSSSRAAQRLALTQPAVSHALARLRALFRDELFVRQSHGVRPTPVAERLYGKLAGALVSVRDAVEETRTFEPATSERSFFVAIAHPMGPLIAVRLHERLAHVAPKVRVGFSTRSRPIDLERGLGEGRIDAAVDWLVPTGDRFSEASVCDEGIVIMARRGHPGLRGRSPARIAASSGLVTLRARVEGEHPVPALRELRHLTFRDTLEVSEFLEVLMVARASDLLATVLFSMQRLAREAFDLRPVPALPRIGPIPIKLVWHRGRQRDPGHAFLREELSAAVRESVRAR